MIREFLCDIIFAVANYRGHGETFYVCRSFFSVAVGYIVDRTFIVLLEYIDIENVFADEFLVGNRSNDILTVAEEDNDIIDIRTTCNELVFFKAVPINPSSRLI